ncbi:MAG: hypothetical protein IJ404_01485 [Clostridia bacterium]|nr:hypothetical protein [Clostridia bacterium]
MATFFNQATLTYSGGSASSNIVSGELVEAISAIKTATTETYRDGESITYVISLINDSDAPSSVLTVTDDLGAYTVGTQTVFPLVYRDGSAELFVDGVPTAVTVVDTQPLTVTGITVPANGDAVLVYTASATEFAPPTADGTVVNTATVTGAGITTPITVTETVTAEGGALLGITKEISPSTVTPNAPLTYTITVTNSGNEEAVATDDLTVSDVFDPILDITSVTLNGVTLTEGTDYTYNETTGEFATVPGRITVPAATFDVDPVTGAYVITPGEAVLVVTGTVQ